MNIREGVVWQVWNYLRKRLPARYDGRPTLARIYRRLRGGPLLVKAGDQLLRGSSIGGRSLQMVDADDPQRAGFDELFGAAGCNSTGTHVCRPICQPLHFQPTNLHHQHRRQMQLNSACGTATPPPAAPNVVRQRSAIWWLAPANQALRLATERMVTLRVRSTADQARRQSTRARRVAISTFIF